MECMLKVLSLPHTKYNNRFINGKSTSTPRQFLDQSVTVENPGRHWSLVLMYVFSEVSEASQISSRSFVWTTNAAKFCHGDDSFYDVRFP